MTDYNNASVKTLLQYYVGWAEVDDERQTEELIAIESALRRAVIREASVGEVTVEIRESEDELTAPKGSPDRIVTCSERSICQTWIPEGTYALVKKEEE